MIIIKLSSIMKGVSMGIMAGAVTYTISSASSRQKNKIKSSTGRAIKAMGDVIDGVTGIFN
ncbi:MAG: hypothetical protein E7509_04865 [Ruminococcus sp.]|nr:hypothetical protein [Ruminococcus sp.]